MSITTIPKKVQLLQKKAMCKICKFLLVLLFGEINVDNMYLLK